MGLTGAQIKERDAFLSKLNLTTATAYNEKKGYIFISYKSDDWEKVFKEKVFELQKNGVRIYCDKNFDDENHPWLDTMKRNLNFSSAVMLFISEEYMTSMATLIELLYAIEKHKEIIPVFLEEKSVIDYNLKAKALDLESEQIKGTATEFTFLQELLDDELEQYEGTFKDSLKKISQKISKSIAKKSLTKKAVKDAFNEILNSGYLQDNAFNKPISTLINTIKSAYIEAQKHTDDYLVYNPIAEPDSTTVSSDASSDSIDINKTATTVTDTESETPGTAAPETKKHRAVNVKQAGLKEVPVIEQCPAAITRDMTLGAFEKLFEDDNFAYYIRNFRASGGKDFTKQFVDYTMAALLRGCDNKLEAGSAAWKYCVLAVASKIDLDNLSLGASQFTWQSNSRKAANIEGNGKLGANSKVFEGLSADTTIGEVEQLFENNESGFVTKDNEKVSNVFRALLQQTF